MEIKRDLFTALNSWKKYLPSLSIRLSLKNLHQDGDLLNVPLYMVDYLSELIKQFSISQKQRHYK